MEILKAAPDQTYPASAFGVPEAPLIYKTNVVNNVDAATLPLSFDISDKMIIDVAALGKCCGYTGLGYVVNLYAQDNAGTYLLASTYGSGISVSMTGDISRNEFEVNTGFLGTNVAIEGVYE